jgi:hypothetical protein
MRKTPTPPPTMAVSMILSTVKSWNRNCRTMVL